MSGTSVSLTRPHILRRIPGQVKLAPEFLAALVRAEQSIQQSGGVQPQLPHGLIFGTIRENCVIAQSVLQINGLDAEALQATEGFPPASQIGKQLQSAKRLQRDLFSRDLLGWFSIGDRSGLLEADLQFHNRHFRRVSDLALLVRMDGQASWAVELYTRLFGGSLSPANHVSSGSWFSPLALPQHDLELNPGQGRGQKGSWYAVADLLEAPLSGIRGIAQRVRGFDPSAVIRRPAETRELEHGPADTGLLVPSVSRQLFAALTAGLIVAATTVAVLATKRSSHILSALPVPSANVVPNQVSPKPVATTPVKPPASTPARMVVNRSSKLDVVSSAKSNSLNSKLESSSQVPAIEPPQHPTPVVSQPTPSSASKQIVSAPPARPARTTAPVDAPTESVESIVRKSDTTTSSPTTATKQQLATAAPQGNVKSPQEIDLRERARETPLRDATNGQANTGVQQSLRGVVQQPTTTQAETPPPQTRPIPTPKAPAPLASGNPILSTRAFAPAKPMRQVLPPPTLGPTTIYSDTEIPIEVTVSRDGRVVNASRASSEKVNQALIGAAEEAAKQWVFQPATIGGQAVDSKYTIVFRFRARH